jgi:hypothetical protein
MILATTPSPLIFFEEGPVWIDWIEQEFATDRDVRVWKISTGLLPCLHKVYIDDKALGFLVPTYDDHGRKSMQPAGGTIPSDRILKIYDRDGKVLYRHSSKFDLPGLWANVLKGNQSLAEEILSKHPELADCIVNDHPDLAEKIFLKRSDLVESIFRTRPDLRENVISILMAIF